MPAQYALPVTLDLIANFMDQTNRRLSLSASIVWSHPTYPISIWLDLAEDALQFAKRQRREQKGLINFLVISSANHRDFDSYYRAALHYLQGEMPVYRTIRPYTPDRLKELLELRQQLANVSRTRLEALRRAVFLPSLFQAELAALRVLTHWRNRDERQRVLSSVRSFIPPGETVQQLAFPFVRTQNSAGTTSFYTVLADLAELWDFLPGGDNAD
jgi:hypothetical protein